MERSGSTAVLGDRTEVTAAWLTDTLRGSGVLGGGRVAAVTVEPFQNKLVSWLLRLRPTYEGEAAATAEALPASMILKITKPEQASPRVKRRTWKEHRFYVEVAPAMAGAPIPRCYGAAYDPKGGRAHLLLEDLSESHERPPHGLPPTPAQAAQDIDCLAVIHGAWWGAPPLRQALALRDDEWYDRRVRVAETGVAEFLAEVGDHLPLATRQALRSAVAAFPELLRRHAAGQPTVAHGDAHCWNFMNARRPAVDDGRLIDWECWDIESGTNDLASLIAIQWFADLRGVIERPLVERYHAGLVASGVPDYGLTACWDDYRRSVCERMLNPIYQWRRGRPVANWWPNLTRIAMAYQDLDCAEVIG